MVYVNLHLTVFPLMREAIWLRGICKFTSHCVPFDVGSHVVAWEMKFFTSQCVPFDAGSHVVGWEMKIFTSGCVPFDAGSHVVA